MSLQTYHKDYKQRDYLLACLARFVDYQKIISVLCTGLTRFKLLLSGSLDDHFICDCGKLLCPKILYSKTSDKAYANSAVPDQMLLKEQSGHDLQSLQFH